MKNQYALPFAVVIVGILIAGAIFIVSRPKAETPTGQTANSAAIQPVDPAMDHIKGSQNAPVMVVEYADLSCPFCQKFESTMNEIITIYGPSGKVAWVYRPFPLVSIHPDAAKQAAAAECVAKEGGNTAYFKFIDSIYANTPTTVENDFDMSKLPSLAAQAGVDETAFNQCYSANTYANQIQQDYNDAIAAGFQGTPTIVIMADNKPALTLSGNQPLASMEEAINNVLQSMGLSIPNASSTEATSSASTAPAGETTL